MPTHRAYLSSHGVISLIMFTLRVMVIKISKNCSFFVFSADGSKKLVIVCAKYLSLPKRSWLNGMANGLWSY